MMQSSQAGPIEILLVEDNEGDAHLAREAMRGSKLHNAIHHVWDREEAMDFLRRSRKHSHAPRPDLILLDLNLPRMDGREVLSEIKTDEVLRRIPVVIATTSSADADILRSYDLYANCYITKPVSLTGYISVVGAIQDFWLTLLSCRSPPPPDPSCHAHARPGTIYFVLRRSSAMDPKTYPLEEALRAQKALRDFAGLEPEAFPIEAFVGMVSDEIEQLRNQGRTDTEIAQVISANSAIQITEAEIARNYASPEQRHARD